MGTEGSLGPLVLRGRIARGGGRVALGEGTAGADRLGSEGIRRNGTDAFLLGRDVFGGDLEEPALVELMGDGERLKHKVICNNGCEPELRRSNLPSLTWWAIVGFEFDV